VRNGDNVRVRLDDFGEVEMDGSRDRVEIEIEDFVKIDLRGEENRAEARVEGMGRVEMDGDKNRITIMLAATKIAATASVLAGLALY
jgi:hypothetical protein